MEPLAYSGGKLVWHTVEITVRPYFLPQFEPKAPFSPRLIQISVQDWKNIFPTGANEVRL